MTPDCPRMIPLSPTRDQQQQDSAKAAKVAAAAAPPPEPTVDVVVQPRQVVEFKTEVVQEEEREVSTKILSDKVS